MSFPYLCRCLEMGNSGSTHNINYERSGLAPNSYFHTNFKRPTSQIYPQNQLSRCGSNPLNAPRTLQTSDCRRSYSSPHDSKDFKFQTKTPFKVLPELDRRLHLKATTNGAILNSGGTISGRKLNEPQTQCIPIRNSGDAPKEKQHIPSEFTRSQTLLNIKVKTKTSDSNLSRMQRHTYSEPELVNSPQQKPAVTKDLPPSRLSSNRNKYLKKRRAPEIPPSASVPSASANITRHSLPNNTQISTTDHAKPTSHFAKNSDRLSKLGKPKPIAEQNQSCTFHRANIVRSSVNGNPSQQKNSNEIPKTTYRREKSSDAIILRSRKPEKNEVSARKDDDKNHQQKSEMQLKRSSGISLGEKPIAADQATKTQRTFYFGMQMVEPTEPAPPLKSGELYMSCIYNFPTILSLIHFSR